MSSRLVGDIDLPGHNLQHTGLGINFICASGFGCNRYLAGGAAVVAQRRAGFVAGGAEGDLGGVGIHGFDGTGEPLGKTVRVVGGVLTQLGRGITLQRTLAQIGEGGSHFSSGQRLAGGESQAVTTCNQGDLLTLGQCLEGDDLGGILVGNRIFGRNTSYSRILLDGDGSGVGIAVHNHCTLGDLVVIRRPSSLVGLGRRVVAGGVLGDGDGLAAGDSDAGEHRISRTRGFLASGFDNDVALGGGGGTNVDLRQVFVAADTSCVGAGHRINISHIDRNVLATIHRNSGINIRGNSLIFGSSLLQRNVDV